MKISKEQFMLAIEKASSVKELCTLLEVRKSYMELTPRKLDKDTLEWCKYMLAVYEGNEDQVADEIDFALKMLNE